MGNANSGRRPEMFETRGQVEDAVILDAGALRRQGACARGASGILQWDGSRARFRCDGSMIVLNYTTRGRAYCQQVRLSSVPLNWRGPRARSRPALLCTECGYRGYKLYLSKRYPYFLCRACQNLIYEIQTYNSKGLCRALLKSIKEERRFEYSRNLRQHDQPAFRTEHGRSS